MHNNMNSINKKILQIKETPIMEIANYGRNFTKETGKIVYPAWFGEGNISTDKIIYNETINALKAGATFYTYQNGIPEVREEISKYINKMFNVKTSPQQHSIVNGGMLGIKICCEIILEKGDEVVIVGPVWPNIRSSVVLREAIINEVSLDFDKTWTLDLNKLLNAITDKTKLVFINSPNNPTGWMLNSSEQQTILDHVRKKNCWLLADEVYHRIVYQGNASPSFLSLSEPHDKLLVINSSSKSFNMTGWRVGWITHPEYIGEHIAKLVQISTTGVPEFIQKGFIEALKNHEVLVQEIMKKLHFSRDFVYDKMKDWSKLKISKPESAFYFFFKAHEATDSISFCKYLITKTQIGLAPGIAFGKSGDNFIRLCFAADIKFLENILNRLEEEFY